jgi:Tfp pilus assembly protein PilF
MIGLGQVGRGNIEAAHREFEAMLALDINHMDAQTMLAAIQPAAGNEPTLLPVAGGV